MLFGLMFENFKSDNLTSDQKIVIRVDLHGMSVKRYIFPL